MARIAKIDKEIVIEGKVFLTHLMDNGLKHTSIARAINYSNSPKIKNKELGPKTLIRICTYYYNNYIIWCNKTHRKPNPRITAAIEELYE